MPWIPLAEIMAACSSDLGTGSLQAKNMDEAIYSHGLQLQETRAHFMATVERFVWASQLVLEINAASLRYAKTWQSEQQNGPIRKAVGEGGNANARRCGDAGTVIIARLL